MEVQAVGLLAHVLDNVHPTSIFACGQHVSHSKGIVGSGFFIDRTIRNDHIHAAFGHFGDDYPLAAVPIHQGGVHVGDAVIAASDGHAQKSLNFFRSINFQFF